MGNFPLMIHLYGLLVGLGILTGFWVASRMARRLTLRPTPYALRPVEVWDALWWVVIPGIVGARLYHVVDLWEYYREHLFLIPALWTGGLGIFGAIVGGVVGLWVYCWWKCGEELVASADRNFLARKGSILKSSDISKGQPGRVPGLSELRKLASLAQLLIAGAAISGSSSQHEKTSVLLFSCVKKRFLAFSDLVAFGLPIGQAIGRWGNFFNQELYGKPTDLPWGIFISEERRAKGLEQYTHFHPLFLYESIYLLLIFGILWFLWRKLGIRLRAGSYFFVYLVLYGAGRFWLEQLRIGPWAVFGVNVAQAMGVFSIILGGLLLYSLNRKRTYEKH